MRFSLKTFTGVLLVGFLTKCRIKHCHVKEEQLNSRMMSNSMKSIKDLLRYCTPHLCYHFFDTPCSNFALYMINPHIRTMSSNVAPCY
jgi:hypothetical protein